MIKTCDLPVVEREVVRLILLDSEGRILLFRIREPLYPEEGTCWELPGGGIDFGETYISAAIRELREETGFVVEASKIESPLWSRRVTFRHAGERRLQNEVIVVVQLELPRPAVDVGTQLSDELEIYCGFDWWSVNDIENSSERFYPSSLPKYLRRVLEGEQINEPFDYFS